MWSGACSRPELAEHWALIEAVANPMSDASIARLDAAKAETPPRTLMTAVQALARALRPEYFGH